MCFSGYVPLLSVPALPFDAAPPWLPSPIGCTKALGKRYAHSATLLDVDVLKGTPEFIDFMGYINTPVNEQQKGAGGSEK